MAASDPYEAEREQRKTQSKAQEGLEIAQFREVLATPAGRAVLWRLLVRGRPFHTSFVAGLPDQTAFNEGRRDNALHLFNEIMRADPASYDAMREENK